MVVLDAGIVKAEIVTLEEALNLHLDAPQTESPKPGILKAGRFKAPQG